MCGSTKLPLVEADSLDSPPERRQSDPTLAASATFGIRAARR
jgi:hypothetical protein